jgi:hypothetical protein
MRVIQVAAPALAAWPALMPWVRSEVASSIRARFDEEHLRRRALRSRARSSSGKTWRKVDDVATRAGRERRACRRRRNRAACPQREQPGDSFVVDGKARSNTQGDDGVGFCRLRGAAPRRSIPTCAATSASTDDEVVDVEEAAWTTAPWRT